MRDLDSAVGRLDNILMTVYLFIVVLLLAVAFVRTFFPLGSCVHAQMVSSRKRNCSPWPPLPERSSSVRLVVPSTAV